MLRMPVLQVDADVYALTGMLEPERASRQRSYSLSTIRRIRWPKRMEAEMNIAHLLSSLCAPTIPMCVRRS